MKFDKRFVTYKISHSTLCKVTSETLIYKSFGLSKLERSAFISGLPETVYRFAFGEPGAFSGEATPVPISNTEVKLICGDDTRKGKVARCRIIK